MRILHLPFGYYPDPVGGTEIYVAALTDELIKLGMEVFVAAPGNHNSHYEHENIKVFRYAISRETSDIRLVYGYDDQVALENFLDILDVLDPHIVHLHAFTSAVSLALVRAAKKRGIPVVLTYHTPTVTCTRGTLLRLGKHICNGLLAPRLCTECTLQGLGLNRTGSLVLSAMPPQLGQLLGRAGRQGGPWTALRMSELVGLRIQASMSLLEEVDFIVALCSWTRELLITNGISKDKVALIRHGLKAFPSAITVQAQARSTVIPRLVFIGRLDPTKGIHIVLKALHDLPQVQIEFDIIAVQQDTNGRYEQEIVHLAGADPRVRLLPPIPNESVTTVISRYDYIVVPSQWLETGPLVVLEAFAARTPVIGSNLGGISELVQHMIDGLLVQADYVEAWKDVFLKITECPQLRTKLAEGIKPPRSMSQVATDMHEIYQQFALNNA